jgi:hypothetical protein
MVLQRHNTSAVCILKGNIVLYNILIGIIIPRKLAGTVKTLRPLYAKSA